MDSKSNYRTEGKENYSNSIDFSGNSTLNSGCCQNFCIRKGSAKGFETIFTHSSVEIEKKTGFNCPTQDTRQYIQWSEDWTKVVFMDEKRFSLDGPDEFQHYWHDLKKESKVISRRSQGGVGAMVWGAIFYFGAVEIIFIEGSLNAQKYLEIIENVKGVIQNQMGMEDFVLQQDNTPTHNARVVKQWLEQSETTLLPWPPFSSDLNIIEISNH
ncbi:hypothetical protein Trydic_g5420 [Trypoxylus dichotomus]